MAALIAASAGASAGATTGPSPSTPAVGPAIETTTSGSYVTAKAEPGDIDVIVALRPEFDRLRELRPFEYNVQSRRMIRQKHRFDVKVTVDGSDVYREAVAFFAAVRADDPEQTTSQPRKGLLRIEL